MKRHLTRLLVRCISERAVSNECTRRQRRVDRKRSIVDRRSVRSVPRRVAERLGGTATGRDHGLINPTCVSRWRDKSIIIFHGQFGLYRLLVKSVGVTEGSHIYPSRLFLSVTNFVFSLSPLSCVSNDEQSIIHAFFSPYDLSKYSVILNNNIIYTRLLVLKKQKHTDSKIKQLIIFLNYCHQEKTL